MLAWRSVMLAKYQKLFIVFFKSAICQLVALCSFTIVPYIMVIISSDTVVDSSV